METAAEPTWVSLKDEELLALRICDLGVRLPGSELEPRVNQLFEDLTARGVTLRPDCYLGDEWFSPDAVPAIAMPFFLAHPEEDFSETFAVWLGSPPEEWRTKYRGWKALDKIEYIHSVMQEVAGTKPAVIKGRRSYEASKLRQTLARYYAGRRKLYAED